MEGCRCDRGEGGWPRSSLKVWRCWAAALEGMRREGVRAVPVPVPGPVGDCASRLDRLEEAAVDGGDWTGGGSLLGVDMVGEVLKELRW